MYYKSSTNYLWKLNLEEHISEFMLKPDKLFVFRYKKSVKIDSVTGLNEIWNKSNLYIYVLVKAGYTIYYLKICSFLNGVKEISVIKNFSKFHRWMVSEVQFNIFMQ